MHKVIQSILLGLAVMTPIYVNAQTGYQGSINLHLLYGEDFVPAGTDLATLTTEHSGSFGAFEQFGFVDYFHETNTGETSAHTEWYPKVSLSRANGGDVGIGPLSDILLGGGINADFIEGDNPWVWLVGPTWKFTIPGFDNLQLETYYYKQEGIEGEDFEGTYQITPSWDITLPVSDQWRIRLTGFTDFIGDRGPGVSQVITQPQFLVDISNLWDNPGSIYAGTEWHYWRNQGGVEGVTESVPQLALRIEL
ncbi:MAG: hypothetical protein WD491_10090 [Balneolales bacterium]